MKNALGQAVPIVPDYLYHYTTVEALAMILKTKKIRLSSLAAVDDMQECRISEASNFARFVFVSSWTDDSEESIPMWNMYAKMERGVRIRMPSMPIKEFELDPAILEKYGVKGEMTTKVGFKPILPAEEFYANKFIPMPYVRDQILHRVEYTNEKSILEPTIFNRIEGGRVNLDMGKLGKYKSTSWAFQREWRYKLWIAPVSFLEMITLFTKSTSILLNRMINDKFPLPTNYFDLSIDDAAFSKMEITLNPKISDGSKTIVELLKREYNPTMIISESTLANTIR